MLKDALPALKPNGESTEATDITHGTSKIV